jgi:type II secretory pathway component PulJ
MARCRLTLMDMIVCFVLFALLAAMAWYIKSILALFV